MTGDFNEKLALGTQNTRLTRLCSECNLHNIFLAKSGHQNFTSPNPGSRVIDCCLVDPMLTHAVTAGGYERFIACIVSNHGGFFLDLGSFLDFDTLPLFRSQTHRDISSRS